MTKSRTLLLSLGMTAMIIFSGCATSPTEAPSASEDYSEPPAAAETPGPSTQSPNPSLTPDDGEAPASYEPEVPVGAPLSMGRIEVRVTDAPPREEVTGILVTVAEGSVEVHRAVAEQEQEQTGEGEQNQNPFHCADSSAVAGRLFPTLQSTRRNESPPEKRHRRYLPRLGRDRNDRGKRRSYRSGNVAPL